MPLRPGPLRIGLIGDHNPEVVAHRAIPLAFAHAAKATGTMVSPQWLSTAALARDPAAAHSCDGLWAVPATPYANGEAALAAIRYARETGLPFLGTCGGYQHALIEYARHVLGLTEAAHAEEQPGAGLLLITPLTCALVEVTGVIHLTPGSRLARICGVSELEEGYHCRYGLDRAQRSRFDHGPLRIVAEDASGEPKAFELDGHPFFFGTAFQPERSGLAGRDHPLITAFVRACAEARLTRPTAAPQVS